MKNETPIIERLEKLANGIESMLDRPTMYAQHPEALEMTILTALTGWATIIDSPLSVKALWREEVIFAYPDPPKGYAALSLSYPPPLGTQAYWRSEEDVKSHKEAFKRITYHLRRVWNQVKHTGGRHEQDI